MIREDDISKKHLLTLIHDMQNQIDKLKKEVYKKNRTSKDNGSMAFGQENCYENDTDDDSRNDYDNGFHFGS